MSMGDVVKAISVTAELTGANFSGAAVAMMAKDLSARHGEDAILHALERCRIELSRPLTSGAVFERLDQDDGRPSGDEAWAIGLQSTDDADTVVWNQEIQQAMVAARPILAVGDEVGARMAFRDSYNRIVRGNRECGARPSWSASLGWDKERRAVALEQAQRIGLLPAPVVAALLPVQSGGVVEDAIFGGKVKPESGNDGDRVAKWCRKIRADLKAAEQTKLERREAEARAQREDLAERKRRAAEAVRRGLERTQG